MKEIRAWTNLHCPKCSNDIILVTKTVPIETILNDDRYLKCHWPGCDWEGKNCDVIKEANPNAKD
jgi:hypothetical protein